MERTLRDHILYLEQRVQMLSDQLTNPNHSDEERTRIDLEIQIAERALAHYRTAFELEQKVG